MVENDILCGQYNNDFGEITDLQVLLPGQLLHVLLHSLHGKAGKHTDIAKMMPRFQQNYELASIASYVTNLVRECGKCQA